MLSESSYSSETAVIKVIPDCDVILKEAVFVIRLIKLAAAWRSATYKDASDSALAL